MKKNRIVSALVAVTLSLSTIVAQTLSGVVKDAEGVPLIGASVWWEGTSVGTTTDTQGAYTLRRVKGYDKIIAAYIGFQSDTLAVNSSAAKLDVTLSDQGVELESVRVTATSGGNFIKFNAIAKTEMISFAGLCKMACCNLAESFENSASVTVGYSDAVSGARQIKMLGLTGTYTQILDENRPIMRGLSSPYGLSYTPGMWLNSIEVSKGISSVTAGHEAITGQINLGYRKPTDEERLFLNLYLNDEMRPEVNLASSLPVSKDGRLSTVILAHASADTDPEYASCDRNDDGFRDMPQARQINFANRWLYRAANDVQIRWGARYLEEDRLGGELGYTDDMRDEMLTNKSIYGSYIHNRNANAYFKMGVPVGQITYDADREEELRSNFAFVADYEYFSSDSYFGFNDYAGVENSVMLNAMYNHFFRRGSSLILGLSTTMQDIDEVLTNSALADNNLDLSRQENEVGIYGEYTFKIDEKFSLIAGLRGDYNEMLDRAFVTPRGQVKWSITPSTTVRASAGVGYRSVNVITDNIGILATGREIKFDQSESIYNPQEKAITWGGSLTQSFKILKSGDATISVDYFRTDFRNQVIVDQEMDSEYIHVYSSEGKSTTDSYQVDLTWKPSDRWDIFATFRYTDSEITLNDTNGNPYTVERPLVSRYKTLLNVQYASHMRRWTFDATAQLNGSSRLPNYAGGGDSPSYPMFYAQVSRRLGDWEIYTGCENIANYVQSDAIISASDPFSTSFNSTAVWGPLMGRTFYIGLRFNLY